MNSEPLTWAGHSRIVGAGDAAMAPDAPPGPGPGAAPPPGGMVGKRELLQWASSCSGRAVTKFEELKDGAVLVRCMEKTWPLAFEVRP